MIFLDGVRLVLYFVLPGGILAWALWRWVRSAPRIVEPAWRSYVAFVAISLAGTSSILRLISLTWARIVRGFPYFDPVLFGFYRWGGMTGLAGLLVSFVGKGKLRWPACGLSALMTLLWAAAAIGE